MTDIQAAVGREQLRRLPEILARRRELVARYRELLAAVPGIEPALEAPGTRSNWQSYWVRLPEGKDQRAVMQSMLDAGVSTRRGVSCAHREPVYAREPWSCGAGPGQCGCAARVCARLAQSELAQDRSLLLPLFHQLTEADQLAVVAALRRALQS